MELSDLEKKILVHIYRYGPDTPWLMARRLLGRSGWAPAGPLCEAKPDV
ncbi:MAG: hypothetical protein JHC13_02505 [Acidilobus sp.]|nr:hypothetical protein [Acidilobus sp.]